MMLYIFLCFCTITQLWLERLRCGHRLCPYQMKNVRKMPRGRMHNGRTGGCFLLLIPRAEGESKIDQTTKLSPICRTVSGTVELPVLIMTRVFPTVFPTCERKYRSRCARKPHRGVDIPTDLPVGQRSQEKPVVEMLHDWDNVLPHHHYRGTVAVILVYTVSAQ